MSTNSLEDLLHKALKEEGFNMVTSPASPSLTYTLDLRLDVSIAGSATSTVDATYEVLKLVNMKEVEEKLGKNLVLVGCDCVLVDDNLYGQPPAYIYQNCVFARGERPAPNIQTTYLAMQGIYPDLPPFNRLTIAQKDMIKDHIEMLADYLRK
ncbi:hypothetical protein pEaSNUABM17_00165 [Erwinia phage pEa_SNUABM_17]|uniref:Uncharacterized protein n=1 Tax=Erwinia phage pEa_SNUABM_17 TaxID=2869545 RepID=A0AAE7XJX7_9CAUD|nr:hypothetical protein MPK72_gp165 [Erwinia phage pEa_SNUABM_17]QZE57711.1 hypothetical protein pEaSNUABM17_00165 [Erwinia phage pEa_SNUABM_17]